MEFRFTRIGVAHSPFTTPGAPPFQSTFSEAEGTIEIFQEYHEGLGSLEGFSHLIILSFFDRADRKTLTEQPLSDGETYHGIFATRHFNRPNPIGISYVELVRIENGTLHVRGLDLLEGTPVLDVKPYVPAFDSIPHAVTGWVSDRHIENIRRTSIQARQDLARDLQRSPGREEG
jgi:tRNA-Thr(GGU) m(6)t(6)A37 methyltransferase TsaA